MSYLLVIVLANFSLSGITRVMTTVEIEMETLHDCQREGKRAVQELGTAHEFICIDRRDSKGEQR